VIKKKIVKRDKKVILSFRIHYLSNMLLPELCRGLPARLNGAKHAEAEAGAGRDRIGQDPVDEGLL
jgi:hypothetical protein